MPQRSPRSGYENLVIALFEPTNMTQNHVLQSYPKIFIRLNSEQKKREGEGRWARRNSPQKLRFIRWSTDELCRLTLISCKLMLTV